MLLFPPTVLRFCPGSHKPLIQLGLCCANIFITISRQFWLRSLIGLSVPRPRRQIVARILIGRRSLTKLLALGGHAIVHVARIKCFPCLPI